MLRFLRNTFVAIGATVAVFFLLLMCSIAGLVFTVIQLSTH